MTTPFSLADVLGQILNTLQTIIYQVAAAVAENASIIATVVVLGGLTYMVCRYGSRIFRGVSGWLRTLF